MSDANDPHHLPPLDRELTSLFAEERSRPEPAADAAQARMLARLETALPVASPAPTLIAKLGPLIAALVLGGAIGAGITAKLHQPTIVYIDRPIASALAPPPPAETIALPVTTRAVSEPSSRPTSPAPSMATIDTLARERELLDTARTSLAKGDGGGALAATERHQREFPRGQMAEEREVLAIQSLSKLGRSSEAAARATDFKLHYPNSVMLGVVDSVMEPREGTK